MIRYSAARTLVLAVMVAGVVLSGCTTQKAQIQHSLQQADADLAAGKDDQAVAEFQKVLQKDQNNVQAYTGLAKLANKSGNLQNMFRYTQRLVELQPTNVQAEARLGFLYILAGQTDRAADVLAKLQHQVGETADVLTMRAMVQMRQGDDQHASATALQAIAKDPRQTNAYAVLARTNQDGKNYADALKYANLGLGYAYDDLNLQLLKLDILRAMNNRDEEINLANAIASAHPTNLQLDENLVTILTGDHLLDPAEKILRNLLGHLPYDEHNQLVLINWLEQNRGAAVAEQQIRFDMAHGHNDIPMQFALYKILHDQKKDEQAEQVLQPIIAHAPDKIDRLEAKCMLAGLYVEQKKIDAAHQLVTEVLQQDARQPHALLLRAGFEVDAGQYDQAIDDLRNVTNQQPNSSQAWALLGQVYAMVSKPDLALQSMQMAYNTSAHAPEFAMMLQSYLLRQDHPRQAQQVLQDMLTQNPADVSGLFMLARSQIEMRDFASANQTADKLAAVAGSAPLADLVRAQIEANTGQVGAALARLKVAYQQYPTDMRVMMQLVNTLLYTHDVSGAENVINELLKRHVDDETAWLLKSQVQLLAKDVTGAIQSMQQAIRLQPDSPAGYRHLADVYLRDNQLQQAEATVQQGLKKNPRDINLLFLQGEIHDLNDLDKAVMDYEQLLLLAPGNLSVINNLVYDLDRKGDPASVQKALQLAKALQGKDNPSFQDTFGWASYKAGNLVDAEQNLRAALHAMPDNKDIQNHLAAVYKAEGKTLSQ